MTSPSNANRRSQLVASALGARVFRVNTGFGWIAAPEHTIKATRPQTVALQPGDVVLRQARPFRAGTVGMPDGAGFVPVKITPEMVGQTVAVSLWVEDKTGKSRPSKEQTAFIRMVRSFGGRAGVSRSEDDTRAIINGEIRD